MTVTYRDRHDKNTWPSFMHHWIRVRLSGEALTSMPHLLREGNLFLLRFTLPDSLYTTAAEINQMGPLLPCKIEQELILGVTLSVFCKHRCASGDLTYQNKENHFFAIFWPFHLFFSIFLILETTKGALYLGNAIYNKVIYYGSFVSTAPEGATIYHGSPRSFPLSS